MSVSENSKNSSRTSYELDCEIWLDKIKFREKYIKLSIN